eukprot:scaffold2615_cov199-Alexandrium_tamarense.AAC.9
MHSHIVLDGKKTNKSVGVMRRVMNLFMRLNPWSQDEKRTRTTENKPQFEHQNLDSKTVPKA